MANAIMGEAIAHAVSKGENRIRKYALDAGEPIAIVSPTPISEIHQNCSVARRRRAASARIALNE
jgi:hypothetical protein